MKKNDIKVGGLYLAKVSGAIRTVRVDAIRERSGIDLNRRKTVYDVTNMRTGRKTTFRSAAKFRQVAPVADRSRRTVVQETADGSAQATTSVPRPEGEQRQTPTTSGSGCGDSQVDCPRCGAKVEIDNGRYDYHKHVTKGTTCGLSGEKVREGEQRSNPTPSAATASVAAAGQETSVDSAPAPCNAVSAMPVQTGLASRIAAMIAAMAPSDDNSPHVIVEARAGTGKTTTLVSALKMLRGENPGIVPSPQQQAVWDAVEMSRGKARTVGFVAFNKSIATELQARVPAGCDAMTMHSLGFKACQKHFGWLEPNQYVVQDIIAELTGRDLRELRKNEPVLLKATEDLVGLCKMNLVGEATDQGCLSDGISGHWWDEQLDKLDSHYEVDLNGSRRKVYDLVPRVLDRCREPRGRINFDDMIWLPVVLDLPVFRYDLLLVDEVQDLNRCQQALAKKAGRRLILCGDPRQAIYGFAGADCESMPRMARDLDDESWAQRNGDGDRAGKVGRGCITLPLTVTRRCGRTIVKEAQKIVSDFQAHESNPEGTISESRYPTYRVNGELKELPWEQSYCAEVRPGDMCLCRVNAPLVSQCFRFLKRGIKANIQGQDVGAGLVNIVKKLCGKTWETHSVTLLIALLDEWLATESAKENAKRTPNEAKLIALVDKHDCLVCFCEDARTASDVVRRIESVFTDDKQVPGVRFSSIHKAKGLEAKRVFLLEPEGATVPHPMARSAWQQEQEMNLRYVAITRAIEELCYVS